MSVSKESLYVEFDRGLSPVEVVEHLNIPNERRRVSAYYGQWKKQDKLSNNPFFEQNQIISTLLQNIYKVFCSHEEFVNLERELEYAQQLILHKIEDTSFNEKQQLSLLAMLKDVRNKRRLYKELNATITDTRATLTRMLENSTYTKFTSNGNVLPDMGNSLLNRINKKVLDYGAYGIISENYTEKLQEKCTSTNKLLKSYLEQIEQI